MAIKSRDEYIESLRKQKPKVYMQGERVESIIDHPALKAGLNMLSVSCDYAFDPEYRDLATVTSPLVNEEISRWIHIPETAEDVLAMLRMMREAGSCGACCTYRHVIHEILAACLVTSYEIDKKYNTNYYERMLEFTKYVQKNDIAIGGAVTDGKGDRSLRPSQQQDPDMYLHVVDKGKDGIVVRGAKPHATSAVYMNMLWVAPIIPMGEDEKDYAVSFFTPIDAEGITIICRPPDSPLELKEMEYPISSNFGALEALVVFEDVFVPWERVCMCGEYEFAGQLGLNMMAQHLLEKCACQAAYMDLKIGATALIADYNGLGKAPHIMDKLTKMIIGVETTYSCAIAAAVEGIKHVSGVYIPALLPQLVGRLNANRREFEDLEAMIYTAGGLTTTMVSEKDYKNPETKEFIEKYYKGKVGVPTEHRVRAFQLIRDLTASEYAGWHHYSALCGMGMPRDMEEVIRSVYNIEKLKSMAKRVAGIEWSSI
jgi:4-hydroxybutyryl-CoA dehydratase/vinylacetyl-CoA-Delta-isomerase